MSRRVACCWGAAAGGALPTSTRASRQPVCPGWRYAVTGRWLWGLSISQDVRLPISGAAAHGDI